MITKKDILHLSSLSRIEVPEEEVGGLVKDLEQILGHFDELKNVKTDSVIPFADATHEKNVTRSDASDATYLSGESATFAFPEKKNHLLKIPPVFE